MMFTLSLNLEFARARLQTFFILKYTYNICNEIFKGKSYGTHIVKSVYGIPKVMYVYSSCYVCILSNNKSS